MNLDYIYPSIIFMVAGTLAGFCSSAPLGPINLWLVDSQASKPRKKVGNFLAGVVLVDIGFAGIAVWGYSKVFNESLFAFVFSLLAGGFMIALGIYGLFTIKSTRQSPSTPKIEDQTAPLKSIIAGGTLCGSNPAFIMFWLYTVSLLDQWVPGPHPTVVNIFFLFGVAVGDSLWFGTLIKIVRKGLNLAKPAILLNIRYGVAYGFLAFGTFTIWQSLK